MERDPTAGMFLARFPERGGDYGLRLGAAVNIHGKMRRGMVRMRPAPLPMAGFPRQVGAPDLAAELSPCQPGCSAPAVALKCHRENNPEKKKEFFGGQHAARIHPWRVPACLPSCNPSPAPLLTRVEEKSPLRRRAGGTAVLTPGSAACTAPVPTSTAAFAPRPWRRVGAIPRPSGRVSVCPCASLPAAAARPPALERVPGLCPAVQPAGPGRLSLCPVPAGAGACCVRTSRCAQVCPCGAGARCGRDAGGSPRAVPHPPAAHPPNSIVVPA